MRKYESILAGLECWNQAVGSPSLPAAAVTIFKVPLHSQCMTKIQVGHGVKSWSNLSRLRFDQDFMS